MTTITLNFTGKTRRTAESGKRAKTAEIISLDAWRKRAQVLRTPNGVFLAIQPSWTGGDAA